jgi:putative transposase
LRVFGYVVMPDHVHLIMSEPQRGTLADAIISQARLTTADGEAEHFWQKRYYDFNVPGGGPHLNRGATTSHIWR